MKFRKKVSKKSTICLNLTLSFTLKNFLNILIGRSLLEPFLKTGITSACFKKDGNSFLLVHALIAGCTNFLKDRTMDIRGNRIRRWMFRNIEIIMDVLVSFLMILSFLIKVIFYQTEFYLRKKAWLFSKKFCCLWIPFHLNDCNKLS